MPNAAQRPVEAPGAALRQSGGEVHARPERAPQNAVEGRNTPARPAPIQKPAAKPVQNEQSPVSPVQPVVQQMVAEEKENMDTLPAGKVEENAPQYGAAGTEPRGYIDSSPKQDDVSEQPTASVFQSDEPERTACGACCPTGSTRSAYGAFLYGEHSGRRHLEGNDL